MLYIEEVHEGDAPPPSEHAGQPVEHLGPLFADGPASAGTMDVATLTAQDIAEHKARLKADAAIAVARNSVVRWPMQAARFPREQASDILIILDDGAQLLSFPELRSPDDAGQG